MSPRLEKPVIAALGGVIAGVAAAIASSNSDYTPPSGVRTRDDDTDRGARWLADCLSDDAQLFAESRLRRPVFDALAQYLKEQGVRDGHASVEEKLLVFLYICGTGSSWRNARFRCGRSLDTVSNHFHEVLDALIPLYSEVVTPASGEIPDAIRDNPKRWPAFKDCVGALDGSHFFLRVPASQQRRFRNRYGDLTQNVLAVVDFDMNFTYVLAGWEGSAHDERVLKDAVRRGFKAPPGRYFLADAGYANKDFLLSPYRGVRYHLREISQAARVPEDKYELFNYRHSSLRNVVERTFGVFKRRWRIFDRSHELSVPVQVKLVYILVAIHNFINNFYSVEDDYGRFEPHRAEETEAFKQEFEEEFEASDSKMESVREEIANLLWRSYFEATGRS
ncbi:hypothetical protein HBI81_243770 [Parastagonospora nodorum]|nr:hypothetical protein HBI18_246270 [Parastagonospora nodorum]KAH6511570.1 hypothetical protein HBI81_243770 [Parastagonospora nodorum]